MPKHIEKLWGVPAPDEAWLIGKGPSLSLLFTGRLDIPKDAVVFGINHAALICIRGVLAICTHCIYLDRKTYPFALPSRVKPIRPKNFSTHFGGDGYFFEWTKDIDPKYGAGSASCALAIFGEWGVKKVNMVGFDSFNGVNSTSGFVPVPYPMGVCDYEAINQRVRLAKAKYGLELEFHFE